MARESPKTSVSGFSRGSTACRAPAVTGAAWAWPSSRKSPACTARQLKSARGAMRAAAASLSYSAGHHCNAPVELRTLQTDSLSARYGYCYRLAVKSPRAALNHTAVRAAACPGLGRGGVFRDAAYRPDAGRMVSGRHRVARQPDRGLDGGAPGRPG